MQFVKANIKVPEFKTLLENYMGQVQTGIDYNILGNQTTITVPESIIENLSSDQISALNNI